MEKTNPALFRPAKFKNMLLQLNPKHLLFILFYLPIYLDRWLIRLGGLRTRGFVNNASKEE